jgi:hypothetical protein
MQNPAGCSCEGAAAPCRTAQGIGNDTLPVKGAFCTGIITLQIQQSLRGTCQLLLWCGWWRCTAVAPLQHPAACELCWFVTLVLSAGHGRRGQSCWSLP